MVHAQVKHGYSCQLQLLSQQSFRVVFASNIRPCERPYRTINNFTAKVMIGANTTPARRALVFKLVVWFGPAHYSHGRFYVSVAPATTWATGTTTTTTPYGGTAPIPPASALNPAPSSPPSTPTATGPSSTHYPTGAAATESSNWAGYIVEGTDMTGASGNMTVPALDSSDGANDTMSAWVGIDGAGNTKGSGDLVQAGFLESTVPCYGSSTHDPGAYTGDEFWVCPWTMALEGATELASQAPDLTLNAGDSLEVNILESSNGQEWEIMMMDTTTNQEWEGSIAFDGPWPLTSAEWIVEDPGDPNTPCGQSGPNGAGQCNIAGYDPPVTFTNMRLSDPAHPTNWVESLLGTPNADMAPSPIRWDAAGNAESFSVAYRANS